MKDITKKYTNGEVSVVWKPGLCIHSAICFKGLPPVFDPRKRPWVTPEGGTTQQIVEQIKKCPSGALSYFMNDQTNDEKLNVEAETIVETARNGPLMVYGNVTIKDQSGNLTKKNKVTAFCRCGASSNKPFCDGSHQRIGFEG
ncbi:MAG: (4Fe-4S)-binding protein [Cyclobacteriaceae bacterium]|nr:(4Fe-4S)-binding protein [Cyclobacteriaceae bacterium]